MSNSTEKHRLSKLSKWKLQDAAAAALGEGWRTAVCLRRQNGATTSVVKGEHGAHYSGLQTCGSVWCCPICSAKIASRRRDELRVALDGCDYHQVLVTYTIQHTRKDKLSDLLDTLKAGLRHTLNGRFRKTFYEGFGVAGYVRSVEIRWSEKSGWHPHVHELLLLKQQPDKAGIKEFLTSRYGDYLEKRDYHVNEHTVDVRGKDDTGTDLVSDYMTKSSIEMEIADGALKEGHSLSAFQLLAAFAEDGETFYAELFREYATSTMGKKWFTWSRGLKAELLPEEDEETDEEIAASDEDGEIVVTLDREEWRKICNRRLRGELLAAASFGVDADLWLSKHRIR